MRIEPALSLPIAMSTSPVATSTALPPDDPPEERAGSCGLRTGPLTAVWLPLEKHSASHSDLPAIVAPASRSRSTSVASSCGTNPSNIDEPTRIGTPATQTLSFTATLAARQRPVRPVARDAAAPRPRVERVVLRRRRSAGVAGSRRRVLAAEQRLQTLERLRRTAATCARYVGSLVRPDVEPMVRGELEQLAVRHRDGRMLSGIVKPTL